VVAFQIFRDQQEVPIFVAVLGSGFFEPGAAGDIKLTANNGVYACIVAFFFEGHHPEHVAMVGNGDAGHAERLCLFY